MLDVKDPAIKLFGKTIPLPETQIPADPLQKSHPGGQIPTHHPQHKHNEDMFVATTKMKVEDSLEEHCKQDKSAAATNDGGDNNQTPSQRDTASDEDRVKSDTSGQEKEGLKKPDKIVPCPRCNSLDTKFCYYNNYNVNQPRHFCKNCQRYWTAGGTMRNVPVGAGRRKNKHIASQYRHIIMSSDGTPTAPIDTPDLANHQILSCGVPSIPARSIIGNEAVMKFRPEAPLCESMTSVLNLGDQKKEVEMAATASAENGQKPPSCGSSMVTSTSGEEVFPENVVKREEHGISGSFCIPTHAVQFYPGPPWLYPWGSGWNGVDPIAPGQCSSEMLHRPDNGNTKVVQWGSTSTVAAPAFCTPPTPFPFGPATYWGCMQGFAAGAWNMPWAGCTGIPSPSSLTSKSGCSSTGSPTLGKHSRDTNLQVENKSEKFLWVPKTLRIDDPDEAAKSSIWDTLGIKPKKNEPLPKGGVFKAFQPKTKGSVCESESTNVMHANPAALSRSQTFQEST